MILPCLFWNVAVNIFRWKKCRLDYAPTHITAFLNILKQHLSGLERWTICLFSIHRQLMSTLDTPCTPSMSLPCAMVCHSLRVVIDLRSSILKAEIENCKIFRSKGKNEKMKNWNLNRNWSIEKTENWKITLWSLLPLPCTLPPLRHPSRSWKIE